MEPLEKWRSQPVRENQKACLEKGQDPTGVEMFLDVLKIVLITENECLKGVFISYNHIYNIYIYICSPCSNIYRDTELQPHKTTYQLHFETLDLLRVASESHKNE